MGVLQKSYLEKCCKIQMMLCPSIFLIKLLAIKETPPQVLSYEFYKIVQYNCLIEHLHVTVAEIAFENYGNHKQV